MPKRRERKEQTKGENGGGERVKGREWMQQEGATLSATFDTRERIGAANGSSFSPLSAFVPRYTVSLIRTAAAGAVHPSILVTPFFLDNRRETIVSRSSYRESPLSATGEDAALRKSERGA